MADNYGQTNKPSLEDWFTGGLKSVGDYAGLATGVTPTWGWGGLSGDDKRAREANKVFNPKTGDWEKPNIYNPFKANTWGYHKDYVTSALPNVLAAGALQFMQGSGLRTVGMPVVNAGMNAARASQIAGATPLQSILPAARAAVTTGAGNWLAQSAPWKIFSALATPLGALAIGSDAVANANERANPKQQKLKTTTPSAPANSVSVDPNELWKNSGPGSKAFWDNYIKYNPKGAMAAKKEDWKNDDTSYANFEAAFKEQNPSLWLSKQVMETKSPLADAYEKKGLTESEESFNRAMAQIEASDKAINKNFGVDKTAQYGATEGDKQYLGANLAAQGMRRSVGQMGVGLEDISNVGANAQASLLAARQAKLLANKGTASELDIKRKQDRNTILQNANNQRIAEKALTLGLDPAIYNSIIQGGY